MKHIVTWLVMGLLMFASFGPFGGLSIDQAQADPGTGTLFGTDASGGNLITVDSTTGVGLPQRDRFRISRGGLHALAPDGRLNRERQDGGECERELRLLDHGASSRCGFAATEEEE